MKIISPIKTCVIASVFSIAPLQAISNQNIFHQEKDSFVYQNTADTIPTLGTTDISILKNAPSPDVYIESKLKKAIIVVDVSKNVLYKYDSAGKPTIAYSVASGKKSTPTNTGIRIVSHVEKYPYRTAPRGTKRRRNPKAYGPKAIILDKLNPVTGERSWFGEFIHGNNDANSIGKYVSNGCMRMDNSVIEELSKQVKRGDIVKIIK